MALKNIKSLSKEEFRHFIDSIDVILSDCDGVLWKETNAIAGSPETVAKFKEMGKKFYYITNNNTKTRSEFVEKCKSLRYIAAVDDVVCTSFLAAMYLKHKNFVKKAYIVGSIGIGKELEALGIQHCGIGPDVMEGDELAMLESFKPDPDVGAVIVGFDKHFSYPKLVKASTYLSNPDVYFIGTNCDTGRPSPNNNTFPGTGCFIQTVEAATSRKAVMLGKPEPFLIEYINQQFKLNPARTLMIGDNCKTDILFGKRCAFKTLLVLTGVTETTEMFKRKSSSDSEELIVPDYYANQLSDVLEMISSLDEKKNL